MGSLYSLIDHWWLLQIVALERCWARENDESSLPQSATHIMCHIMDTVGVEVCGESTRSWHVASANVAGGKCWTAKPNTVHSDPLSVLGFNGSSRQAEPIGLQQPFEWAHKKLHGVSVMYMQGASHFWRELWRAHSATFQTAHRGEVKREWSGLCGATAGKWQHMRERTTQSLGNNRDILYVDCLHF